MRLCKHLIISSTLLVVRGLQKSIIFNVIDRQGNKCGLCKTKFCRMVPHEIHHLNHNSTDNNKSNLLALCPNCHSAHHRYGVPVYPYFANITKNL